MSPWQIEIRNTLVVISLTSIVTSAVVRCSFSTRQVSHRLFVLVFTSALVVAVYLFIYFDDGLLWSIYFILIMLGYFFRHISSMSFCFNF